MTTVVHVTRDEYDVYIGHKRPGVAVVDSVFCKPWSMGGHGRDYAMIAFAAYWFAPEQKELRELAKVTLSGKRIACWCAPKWCHGDIIAGYLNWRAGIKEDHV